MCGGRSITDAVRPRSAVYRRRNPLVTLGQILLQERHGSCSSNSGNREDQGQRANLNMLHRDTSQEFEMSSQGEAGRSLGRRMLAVAVVGASLFLTSSGVLAQQA